MKASQISCVTCMCSSQKHCKYHILLRKLIGKGRLGNTHETEKMYEYYHTLII
jgi:hypothetical protein